MKIILILLAAIFVVVVLVLGILLCLASPRDWPMTPGTLTAKKVSVDGKSFVMVEGQPMNYLGQIQSINIDFDDSAKQIMVTRCIIHWNPFSKFIVNNQWPVIYPLANVKPGKYSVVYRSSEGEQTAGNFEVP